MAFSEESSTDAGRSFEEFADVTEDELLRVAWLITCDRERATALTETALVRMQDDWRRLGADQPVRNAYRLLVQAIKAEQPPLHPEDAVAAEGSTQRVQLRQNEAEKVLGSVPIADRTAMVLRHYANLSTLQVSDIVGGTPVAAERRSDQALELVRARSTDLQQLPYDDVPCPAAPIDRDRISAGAARSSGVSRRRVLGGVLGATAAVTVGVAAWWQARPHKGIATVELFVPRASGVLFLWLRASSDPPPGEATLQAPPWAENATELTVGLDNRGGRLRAAVDGKPAPLSATPWGAHTTELPSLDPTATEVPPMKQTLVIGKVPSDTDAVWVVANFSGNKDASVAGIEMVDHSTYAVARTVDAPGEVNGLIWRTASQQIAASNGEKASFQTAKGTQVTLLVLPKSRLRGFLQYDSLQTMPIDDAANFPAGWIDTQLGTDGWNFLAIFEPGTTNLKVTQNPKYGESTLETFQIERSGYLALVAASAREPAFETDGPTTGIVNLMTWTDAAGRSHRWSRHTTDPALN